ARLAPATRQPAVAREQRDRGSAGHRPVQSAGGSGDRRRSAARRAPGGWLGLRYRARPFRGTPAAYVFAPGCPAVEGAAKALVLARRFTLGDAGLSEPPRRRLPEVSAPLQRPRLRVLLEFFHGNGNPGFVGAIRKRDLSALEQIHARTVSEHLSTVDGEHRVCLG